MNASILSALFNPAIQMPAPAPAASRFAALMLDGPVDEQRRNRYPQRNFGIGYGRSDGYARARTYFATPSLSRYR